VTTAFLFASLFLFMALGMPVAISLGLSSLLTILFFADDSLASLSIKLYETSEHYTLLAIPFFILAGTMMSTGGVAKRMVRFAIASVGHLRAGTLGILIPPSIVMVVYASVTEVSVGRMFMAGIIPGILLASMLAFAVWWRAGKLTLTRTERANPRELLIAFKDSVWGLALLVIIMGGIYGGIFTPTEAAAVAAVYATFIAVFVYRDIGVRQLPEVLMESGRTTVMLMFIVANALLFAHVLTTERIPQTIAEHIVAAGMAPWMFLLVVNFILLVAGNFMEPTGIILILAPILFPIATHLGIDPIHLGIIIVVNMEIGMITPPVGLNLFVTSGITGMSLVQVTRAALPWLAVLLLFLMMITYIPQISLWLPEMLYD
jgi:C4-dicarboxylate transporter DctM subunit